MSGIAVLRAALAGVEDHASAAKGGLVGARSALAVISASVDMIRQLRLQIVKFLREQYGYSAKCQRW